MENRKYITDQPKGRNVLWTFIVGIVLIFAGSVLGSLPYNALIAMKIANGEADSSRMNEMTYLFTLMDKNINLMYMMLPFITGVLAIYLVVKFIHKRSLKTIITSRKQIDYKRIWFSFSVWGAISSTFIILNVYLSPETMIFQLDVKNFMILVLLGLILIPIQTSFEELLFRGYLMQAFGIATKTKWFPLVMTSVVFGLMHLANPEVDKLGKGVMVIYIGMGFLLGILTLLDDGMELSLGFHAANNIFTALLVTSDWTAFQTYSLYKDISDPNLTTEIIMMLVLVPLLIFIFHKKYQFKNWKEQLL